MRAWALVLALLPVSAPQLPPLDPPRNLDWRAVATPADRIRLRHWRDAWMAVMAARPIHAGDGDETALFDPDRALPGARPPPGLYRCHRFHLTPEGAAEQPTEPCAVAMAGEVAEFAAASGRQRPVGQIFDDTDARAVLLGTLELSDETRPMAYGRDRARDVAGLVERIGAARWRVVLPYPRFGGTLDVIEMVPASPVE